MSRRLPVTLVGGFPGAGKTSLLHDFVSRGLNGYLAVLVENPGPLNLDAKALRGLCGAMRRQQDVVLELPNGGEAAQLDWLARTLRELAAAGRFEQVLVETAGTTNAARLAWHFSGDVLSKLAEVREIICVVDALDFHRGVAGGSRLRQETTSGAGLAEFQRAQIADASLIVLNKCDLVGEAERHECLNILHGLNPEASLAETALRRIIAGSMESNRHRRAA